MDSKFVKHKSCPSCGSRDNLATYSDGHCFCFGCGYKKSSSKEWRIRGTSDRQNGAIRNSPSELPRDSIKELPSDCLQWLYKYELTPQEIQNFNLFWSESLGSLIFPIKQEDVLLGYVARKFKGDGPKYRIKGEKRKFSMPLGTGRTIVFTEDLISATIVSRVTTACCLYGTSLPSELVSRLASFGKYDKYLIWLDKDKRSEALKQALYFKQFGYNFGVIMTEKDPKEYSNEQIEKELWK